MTRTTKANAEIVGEYGPFQGVDQVNGVTYARLEMPPGVGVSGLDSDGGDRFFCGGGGSGKVRVVRRPRTARRR